MRCRFRRYLVIQIGISRICVGTRNLPWLTRRKSDVEAGDGGDEGNKRIGIKAGLCKALVCSSALLEEPYRTKGI